MFNVALLVCVSIYVIATLQKGNRSYDEQCFPLLADESDNFQIDPGTGVITTAAVMDYDTAAAAAVPNTVLPSHFT